MNDIVIDTNVLVHTNNKNNRFNKSALKSLEIIQNHDLSICVDDVFNRDESQNTSIIGHEYIKHVRQGHWRMCFCWIEFRKEKLYKSSKRIIRKSNKNWTCSTTRLVVSQVLWFLGLKALR
jgi:hypothetical protein